MEGNIELLEDDYKTISKAIIMASNFTETEWLKMEKSILESLSSGQSEITCSNVFEMWNHLHRKVEGSIDRMKIQE